MTRRIVCLAFAMLFVAAAVNYASAQDAAATDPAPTAGEVVVAPCDSCCTAPCCCAPRCFLPRRVVCSDPCYGPVVYRRGLFGCYRPVCPPPVVCCDPCCPPPRFYRPWRAPACCW